MEVLNGAQTALGGETMALILPPSEQVTILTLGRAHETLGCRQVLRDVVGGMKRLRDCSGMDVAEPWMEYRWVIDEAGTVTESSPEWLFG
ncbi:hypothetical protein BaRGS_00023244 [Batillaria attramentaria]|uniref:Uncharacterized protein n=1 Tax=Batillaria attramentaria TaxID=370345 RepID=A0ABD0KEV9_9CAEN